MWLVFVNGPLDCTPAFRSAKDNNLKVLTLWLGKSSHDDGDLQIIYNGENIDEIIQEIQIKIDLNLVIGFIAFTDSMVPLAGLLNSKLKLNSPYNYQQVLLAKNKFKMRELLSNENFNPKYQLLNYDGLKSDIVDQVVNLDFTNPWIVKPIFGHSSIGVTKVTSLDELNTVLPSVHDANSNMIDSIIGLDSETKDQMKNTFLLESFFNGTEFSVEVIVLNGKIIPLEVCSKTEMKEPYFEEITYIAPGDCSQNLRVLLFEASLTIVQKMGIDNTCAHLEFRWDGTKLCFLDIGLRSGGGGLTHKLIEISSGRSLFGAWFAALKGNPLESMLISSKNSIALLYLSQVRQGGVVSNKPYNHLPNEISKFLMEYKLFAKPGDILNGYPNYSGLPGYALFEIPMDQQKNSKATVNLIISESSKYFDPHYEV